MPRKGHREFESLHFRVKILTKGLKFVFEGQEDFPVFVDFGLTEEQIRDILDSHTATFRAQDWYLDQTAALMHRTLLGIEQKV